MSRIKSPDHLTFFQRLLVIIQLCLALSVLLWYGAQPFLGEYFNIKSKLMLYEYIKGISPINDPEKLNRNKMEWEALPEKEKAAIQESYLTLKQYAERPVWVKIRQGMGQLIDLPPFELAWIFFTIWISILLLRGRQGAFQVVWLLPLIALCYAIDNRISGIEPRLEPDAVLIPSEKFLVDNFLEQGLSPHWQEQRMQLESAWNRFLVNTYLKEPIQENIQQLHMEKAGYLFTLARIDKIAEQDQRAIKPDFHEKTKIPILGIIVLWNLFFAWKLRLLITKNLV